ncbi:uncharacterized protein F4812DRAFT_80663 [Daldinia caldariorum]|uniref:uncharacterized protein n=1 Tax=Daldinia caldariorum TaxID=326644 RepID=UPI002008E946|nr:uncharacterized protein F4812DRAFT_80663 [Daldinia caldariorum]KAI1466492.1 hypothetical protein F4812DRAFT_80663 [Daldinia caldariorum]
MHAFPGSQHIGAGKVGSCLCTNEQGSGGYSRTHGIKTGDSRRKKKGNVSTTCDVSSRPYHTQIFLSLLGFYDQRYRTREPAERYLATVEKRAPFVLRLSSYEKRTGILVFYLPEPEKVLRHRVSKNFEYQKKQFAREL